jgi:hypothetical protein
VEVVNLRVAERPAGERVEPLAVEVVSVWRSGAARALTVRECTPALGRLGGHPGRRGDGRTGWQTLWRGWNQLHATLSYELSKRR